MAKAPEVTVGPAPAWVVPPPAAPIDEVHSGAVRYQLSNSQVFHRGTQKQYYQQLVMEPLNQQGVQEVSELNFEFYPSYEQLVVHEISIYRDGVKTNRLQVEAFKLFQTEEELDSKLYSERWRALYILEDIRPGDIITYAYTVDGSNPIFERSDFGSLPLNWGAAVGQRHVRVISDKPIRYRFNNAEVPVATANTEHGFEYLIDLHRVPAIPAESQFPHWHEPQNYFQYTGYSNWREVSDWALGLYDIDRALPDAMKASLDQWRADLGVLGAVNRAVRLVQEDIRYFGIELGINSHLPRTPQETLNKRYGDCKDKALLMTAMLDHLGVESYPALVSASRREAIDDDLPSPNAFDHVINLIRIDGHEYWVDGTASAQGADIRNKGHFDYERALVVRPGSRTLVTIATPSDDRSTLTAATEERFAIDAGANTANLTIQSTFNRLKAEQARQYFRSLDQRQVNSNHANFLAQYYPGVQSTGDVTFTDDLEQNRMVVTEAYQIDRVAPLISARRIFTLYGSSIASYLFKPEERIRHSPLALPHPLRLTHQIFAEIQGEVLWQDPAKATVIENPWFRLSREASLEDSALAVAFEFESKAEFVNHRDLPEYLAQLDKLDEALQYRFWAKGSDSGEQRSSREMKNLIKSLIRK
ncbi:DUF3857 domain-containing transglutaminase family protein [Microbulbifer aggregans]|uniref:DUF3857 domain-containing transglutaminase family protein n=1 Tax=Microbulbifer aggregans TaxID=1769779 RepID=UPI0008595758|nr:DUF3857 domain-containing protein [Microbulbifer aggregans]